MKRRQVCPNPACEKHGQPTGIMGGCDCGSALVPYKSAPTDEQLELTMVAMGVPAETAMLMTITPGLRQGALDFHALVQQAMDGDRAANDRLAMIRRYFAA